MERSIRQPKYSTAIAFSENRACPIKTKWIERASPLVVEKSRIRLRDNRRHHFAELTRCSLISVAARHTRSCRGQLGRQTATQNIIERVRYFICPVVGFGLYLPQSLQKMIYGHQTRQDQSLHQPDAAAQPRTIGQRVWLTEQVPVEYLDINTNSEVRA